MVFGNLFNSVMSRFFPNFTTEFPSLGQAVYSTPLIDTTTTYQPILPSLLSSFQVQLENKNISSIDGIPIPYPIENALRASLKFTSLAYCNRSEIRTKSCFGCADSALTRLRGQSYFQSTVKHGDIVGFVGVDDATQTIILVFRGSKSAANWIVDFAYKNPFKRGMQDSKLIPGTVIHSGFAYSYRYVKPLFQARFVELIRQHPTYSISFIGHSLGGAIAVTAAADAMQKDTGYLSTMNIPASRVNLFTFGAPRVGDGRFVRLLDTLGLGNVFRVVNGSDIVTHVPPISTGFRHMLGQVYMDPKLGGRARFTNDYDRAHTMNVTSRVPEETNGSMSHGRDTLTRKSHSTYFNWKIKNMCSRPDSTGAPAVIQHGSDADDDGEDAGPAIAFRSHPQ